MQKIRNLVLLTFILGIILSFTHKPNTSGNAVVSGVVLADNTGKPLSNAHVYIVHGEEEALTNSKGEFSIETAKKFPVTLTAEHQGFKKFQAMVTSPGQKQIIKLKSH